jgi:hypothetical protein
MQYGTLVCEKYKFRNYLAVCRQAARSAVARWLGLRFRIPPGARTSLVNVVG